MILAANTWNTNADIITDCVALGYLAADRRTLDPTYGRGNWWTKFRPDELVSHDIRQDGVDFRKVPHADASFDAVAFDPPYVCVGGRKTTGMPDFHDRYGLEDTPRRPEILQELINDGLTEMARVARPKAFILAKCQDYVTGGRIWHGTLFTANHGLSLGLDLFDRLEHVSMSPRPQPRNRHTGEPLHRQVHARRNLSTLLVFRKRR